MLDAINAIVSFLNMIVHFVQEFILYTSTLVKFSAKAYTVCFNIMSYIPSPFLQFALLTFTVVIIFCALRILHG